MDVLTSILASKLYISSDHKDRIYSAVVDPTNKELVKQLESYLKDDSDSDEEKDDSLEYVKLQDVDMNVKRKSKNVVHPSSDDEEQMTYEQIEPQEKHEEYHEEFEMKNEVEDDNEEENNENNENNGIETSSSVNKHISKNSSSVKASIKLLSKIDYVSYNLDGIKGILNANSDTSGVIRVAMKENELWCYYDDSINLNDIMVNVVELLSSSGYCSCLEFNRLARSDNAIVFEVDNESQIEVKSISDEDIQKG